ncbi:unnamed protein product, partial [Protopolystoma xenopodis]
MEDVQLKSGKMLLKRAFSDIKSNKACDNLVNQKTDEKISVLNREKGLNVSREILPQRRRPIIEPRFLVTMSSKVADELSRKRNTSTRDLRSRLGAPSKQDVRSRLGKRRRTALNEDPLFDSDYVDLDHHNEDSDLDVNGALTGFWYDESGEQLQLASEDSQTADSNVLYEKPYSSKRFRRVVGVTEDDIKTIVVAAAATGAKRKPLVVNLNEEDDEEEIYENHKINVTSLDTENGADANNSTS